MRKGLVALLVGLTLSAAHGQSPGAQTAESPYRVWQRPASIAGVLLALGQCDGSPSIFEWGDIRPDDAAPEFAVERDTSVRTFMADYTQLDDRFEMREITGVPVLRLVVAWDDAANPLNRRLPGAFSVTNVSWAEAVYRLCLLAKGDPAPQIGSIDYSRALVPVPVGRQAARERPISVALSEPTLLDATVATIRAHGELGVFLYTAGNGRSSRDGRGRPRMVVESFYHDSFRCRLP